MESVEFLCQQALNPDYSIRETARHLLRQDARRNQLARRPECVENLVQGLGSPDVFIRMDTAKLFNELGGWTPPCIKPLLFHAEEHVRNSALDAIGPIPGSETVVLLALASIDPDASVRTLARDYLKTRHPDWAHQPRCATLVKHVKSVLDVASLEVAEAVRDLLVDIEAVEVLIWATHHSQDHVRHVAVEGLGWLRTPNGLGELKRCLGDQNWQVREAAVYALASIGDHSAIASIQTLALDEGSDVRATVSWALSQFRGP